MPAGGEAHSGAAGRLLRPLFGMRRGKAGASSALDANDAIRDFFSASAAR